MASVQIDSASLDDGAVLATLLGELLHEIMAAAGAAEFNFCQQEAQVRAEDFLRRGVWWAFIARVAHQPVGFISLYASHALYAEGDFGTIAELYVRPPYRSQGIGGVLIAQAKAYAVQRGWQRLEVTTPPLPAFQRTLAFYESQGFSVAGGRKLKSLL